MKYRLALVLSLCGSISGLAIEKADLEDASTKRSYGLGANYGKSLSRGSIEINVQSFMDGLKDGIAGKSLLTDTEIQAVIDSINQEIRERQKRKQEELAAKNKKDGEDFLTANSQKEGVVGLASGLQYKIIREGNGAVPKATDKVKVHYKGTLIDGTVFDNSYGGDPVEFFVRGVIKGWTEALQRMKTGAKWQLYIPSELAYGERGTGSTIGPNATLLFDVELLDITTTPKPKPKPITSDIIRVPSAEEMEKGDKPEVIKADEIDDYIEKEKKKKAQEAKAKEEAGKNVKDAAEDTTSTEEKNPKPSPENSSNKEQEEQKAADNPTEETQENSPQKDQS